MKKKEKTENPLKVFENLAAVGNLQRAWAWRLKFEFAEKYPDMNEEYLEQLSFRVKEFVDEKQIIFNEYDDFMVTRAFDHFDYYFERGTQGRRKFRVILEFYDMALSKVTFTRTYVVYLKRHPFHLTLDNSDTLKIAVDMIPAPV